VAILARISQRPASARQIAEETRQPEKETVFHTTALHESGCIGPVDSAETDPYERVYEITIPDSARPRLSFSDSARDEAIPSVLRQDVCNGLAALEAGALDNGESGLRCELLVLDKEGKRQVREIVAETSAQVAAATSASAKRLAGNREAAIRAAIAFPTFKPPRKRKRDT
jgi:hypothetical protein